MSDPLDLDARMDELTELVYATRARGDALGLGSLAIGDLLDVIESDRAELRTARAERDAIAAEKKQLRGHASELIVLRDALRAERDALAARIEAAKAIHYPTFNPHSSTGEECDCCGQDWPCETVSALSGATEPAAGADLPIEFDLDSVAEALPPFDPSVERVAGPRLIPCPRCGRDRWAPADWDGESIDALVAELRTARAARDDLLYQIHVLTDSENGDVVFAEIERDALAARIAGARSLCDKWESQLLVPVATIRAALSGATEPAADSEPTCPLHGLPLGPAPAKNCPECRRQIAHTLGEETR